MLTQTAAIVARNNYKSDFFYNKYGEVEVEETTAPRDLNSTGTYFRPSSGVQLEVLSTDADDTLLGSGAQVIKIWGIDLDWNYAIFEVEMNGTTPVQLPLLMLRVFRARVVDAETSSGGLGTISIRETAIPTNVWAEMYNGQNTTNCASITSPKNKAMVLLGLSVNAQPKRTANIIVEVWMCVNNGIDTYLGSTSFAAGTHATVDLPIPTVFPPKTDFWFIVREYDGSQAGLVFGNFHMQFVAEPGQ